MINKLDGVVMGKHSARTTLFLCSFFLMHPVAAADRYSGFYAGLQAGYAHGDLHGENFNGAGLTGYTIDDTLHGGLVGGVAGFGKLLDRHVMVGLEADFESRGMKDGVFEKDEGIPVNSYRVDTRIRNGASVRGRLGYTFNADRTLAYVTGGYATTRIETRYTDIPSAIEESHEKWYNGWTAGLGMEHYFSDQVSARAEYRYSDLGRKNVPANLYANTYRMNYEDEQSARIGVMYHF